MKEVSLVSIVIPIFNETEGLDELRHELSHLTTNHWNDQFEFVLVDDGSTDETWSSLVSWAENDNRVRAVRLAGNCGAHNAGRAGLEVAAGDCAVIIPADLQEGIDLVKQCIESWHDTGTMVVMMVPEQGRAYDRVRDAWSAQLYYGLMKLTTRLYTDVPVQAMVKLMDRVCIQAYLKKTSKRAMRTPFVLQQKIPFELVRYRIQPRHAGRSKWSFYRKLRLMFDMLMECGAWLLSPWWMALLVFGVYSVLLLGNVGNFAWSGVLRMAADLWLAGGLLGLLSITGAQLGRIHQEIYGGPAYIIREIYGGDADQRVVSTKISIADTHP